MAETLNYKLEKYDAGSSANLLDQYNSSMDKVDAALKQINDKAEQAGQETALPDGLEAFCTALGISSSNAATPRRNAKPHSEQNRNRHVYRYRPCKRKENRRGFIIPGNVA